MTAQNILGRLSLTTEEYAKTHGTDRDSVSRWIREGLLPEAFKMGRLWHIPPDARPLSRESVALRAPAAGWQKSDDHNLNGK